MNRCEICGMELQLPFRCNYCYGTFCSQHRLPEAHVCSNKPREAPSYIRENLYSEKPRQSANRQTSSYYKPKHKRGNTHKYAIAVTIILALVLFAYYLYPIVLSALSFPPSSVLPSPSTSQIPSHTITPTPQKSATSQTQPPTPTQLRSTPSPTPNAYSQEELVNYALSLINSDRQAAGLPKVTLSIVDSGQIHADNMLSNEYFSHWDTQGYKPYMRYTLAGGKGAVAENCAWQGQSGNFFGIDVKSVLKDMEWSMMYDDAGSNWGHRDNILNPSHNEVSIGIAYDYNNVYLVQDFEDDYVTWSTLSFSNNQVVMEGTIAKQATIQSVTIFYDKTTALTVSELKAAPYQGSYDPGTYVGMALPPNWQATGAITITSANWNQNGNAFQIGFSLSQAIATYGKGVYTLYVETGSSTADSLTTYSIWIN